MDRKECVLSFFSFHGRQQKNTHFGEMRPQQEMTDSAKGHINQHSLKGRPTTTTEAPTPHSVPTRRSLRELRACEQVRAAPRWIGAAHRRSVPPSQQGILVMTLRMGCEVTVRFECRSALLRRALDF